MQKPFCHPRPMPNGHGPVRAANHTYIPMGTCAYPRPSSHFTSRLVRIHEKCGASPDARNSVTLSFSTPVNVTTPVAVEGEIGESGPRKLAGLFSYRHWVCERELDGHGLGQRLNNITGRRADAAVVMPHTHSSPAAGPASCSACPGVGTPGPQQSTGQSVTAVDH